MKTGPAVGAPNHPHENRSATGYLINLFMAAVSAGRRGYDVAPTARSILALGNAPDILNLVFSFSKGGAVVPGTPISRLANCETPIGRLAFPGFYRRHIQRWKGAMPSSKC